MYFLIFVFLFPSPAAKNLWAWWQNQISAALLSLQMDAYVLKTLRGWSRRWPGWQEDRKSNRQEGRNEHLRRDRKEDKFYLQNVIEDKEDSELPRLKTTPENYTHRLNNLYKSKQMTPSQWKNMKIRAIVSLSFLSIANLQFEYW